MDGTTDYDLEELESRLYSQVFHSTEKWEIQTKPQILNIPTRHVTSHVVSNVPMCGNRYWDGNINNNLQNPVPSGENSKENTSSNLQEFIPLNTLSPNSTDQTNPSLQTVDERIVPEHRTKPLVYNRILIPPYLELPKSKIRRIPENIIQFFNLHNHKCKKNFRQFLRNWEKINKTFNQDIPDVTNENNTPIINVSANENEKNIVLSDISVVNNENLTTPQKIEITEEIKNIETITLSDSDSDSDSVIEVPLPPIPVYSVDSSESETEEDDLSPENESEQINEDKQPDIATEIQEIVQETSKDKQNNESTKGKTIEHNTSFTELEKERDEYLHTPDSNTNDFLEHDTSLNKNNFQFNFALHSSDLDLSKDKDEPSKTTHDLYETESNCSEMSLSKTRPVFNEINFESPTKDIFCEPDLSKFSNFITPNRKSNQKFKAVKTKASEDETRRRSRSGSSEYNSDATTLKPTKKSKKSKKKNKKKTKQSNEGLDMEETPAEMSSENRIEENTEKIVDKKAKKKRSADKDENTAKNKVKEKVTEHNSDIPTETFKNLEESQDTEKMDSPSLSEYYKDTYFADDTWIVEQLETHSKSPTNNEKSSETTENVTSQKSNETFSFVETFRKLDKEKKPADTSDELPIKKLKTDSPVQQNIVTINLSDDDVSGGCEVIEDENSPRVVTIDDSDDLIVINVNAKPRSKFSFINTYLQNKDKKSFRDFWTLDMNKFYNESWGQENFDLQAVQSSMSGNRADWTICQEDLYGISRRKRGPACTRCREIGHIRAHCTRFSGPENCSICGFPGHYSTRCPNTLCTNCRKPAFSLTSSCGKCSYFGALQCNICNTIGHETKYCPDLWRRYHLTTKSDSALNTSTPVLKSPSERWCSNCARRGHSEDKCTFLRSFPYFPSSAGIISYVPTYDESFKLPNQPPAPNIPMFKDSNVTLNDLRTMRKNVVQDNISKYSNILKQLRKQCSKYDVPIINQIERLQRSLRLNSEDVSRKKIQEIYKLRARLQKHKVS